MENLRIMLCCGAGFSSGLLAQKSRQYAKKNGIAATVDARSESQVGGYLDKMDILLLGPHYANELEHFREMCAPYGIKVAVIPSEIYGMVDGKKLVELAFSLKKEEKEKKKKSIDTKA